MSISWYLTSVTDALKALDTIGNDKIIFSTNLLGNNEQWRAVDSIKHCKKGIVEKLWPTPPTVGV